MKEADLIAELIGEIRKSRLMLEKNDTLRISQFFENSLKPHKWHSDLLCKMTIDIEGVRKAAISDQTYTSCYESGLNDSRKMP